MSLKLSPSKVGILLIWPQRSFRVTQMSTFAKIDNHWIKLQFWIKFVRPQKLSPSEDDFLLIWPQESGVIHCDPKVKFCPNFSFNTHFVRLLGLQVTGRKSENLGKILIIWMKFWFLNEVLKILVKFKKYKRFLKIK